MKYNEPAFPSNVLDAELTDVRYQNEGMSLRDWFAGQALAGTCADRESNSYTQAELAATAYSIADAMLAESNRE